MRANDRLSYWLKGKRTQNFGDFLAEFLADELFIIFDEASRLHLTGSVIDDGFVPPAPSSEDGFASDQIRASFWGCGIRTRGGLLPENKAHIDLFAVRGPISAADLRLGDSVPTGDPSLLLPALYEPRPVRRYFGQALCVPHINDERSDDELLTIGRGDVVLRTSLPNEKSALLQFIDAVASADFVLSASLHGAIVAAAYRKPFAFWDNGRVDLPTKWEDFARYAGIDAHGCASVTDGRQYYTRCIEHRLKIPSLWPLLASAPCQLKPLGALKVLRYELLREGHLDIAQLLDPKIEAMLRQQRHFDTLAERTRSYATKRVDALKSQLSEATLRAAHLETEVDEMKKVFQQKQAELETVAKDASEELSRVALDAEKSRATAAELHRQSVDLRARLDEELEKIRRAQVSANQRAEILEKVSAEVVGRLGSVEKVALGTEGSVTSWGAQIATTLGALGETMANSERTLSALLSAQRHASDLERERSQFAIRETQLVDKAAQLSAQLEMSQTAIDALEVEQRRLSSCNEELRLEMSHTKQARDLLHDRLVSSERHHEEAVKRISGDLIAARVTLEEMTSQSAKLSEELARMRQQCGRLVAEIGHEKTRTEVAQRELGQMRSETHRLQQELNDRLEEERTGKKILEGELAACQAELDATRASAVRANQECVFERLAKRRVEDRIARLEYESVARAAETTRRQQVLDRISGRGSKQRRTLARQVQAISDYVSQFEPSRLMAPGPEGRTERIIHFILASADTLPDMPLFDVACYRRMYQDRVPRDVNALVHYLGAMGSGAVRPHVLFDTEHYRTRYPDAASTNLDGLAHYVRWGADKGYDPHPLFDTEYYLRRYADVAIGKINPLAHYLQFPGCCPHPLFDSDYYMRQNPLVARAGQTPLEHYLLEGGFSGVNPHRWFDSRYYLERNPDVSEARVNPLLHFVLFGAGEGRDPHPEFSTRAYLAQHPELAESRENPLIHFLASAPPTTDPRVAVRAAAPASVDAPLVRTTPDRLESRSANKVALLVDAFYPRPDQDSGSLDQIAFVRIFQNLGYEVHFAADLELGTETPYRDQLERAGVRCITYPKYVSIQDYLAQNGKDVAVALLSRVHFGGRHTEAVRELCPNSAIIFNTVDLSHVRERREAQLKQDNDALARAEETYRLELEATHRADATIVVSDHEAKYWRAENPQARVFMVPLLRDYRVRRHREFEFRSGIGFVGGYQHAPNVDAVLYFLDHIWPRVRQALPQVAFHVIGSHLPDTIRARGDEGVVFVGYVEDLEAYLADLRLTVAPLRYGAGAKGKVVSSLAFGVPCIASTIAAEGMGLTHGLNVAVADTPEEFAAQITSLYNDRAIWTAQSDKGMELVRARHSLDHGSEILRKIIESVGVAIPDQTAKLPSQVAA